MFATDAWFYFHDITRCNMNQLLYLLSSKEAWNHKNFCGLALMNSWHNGKSSDCNRGFLVYWKNWPNTGIGFCLWLPFTQIAEFCLWEPKIWSPGIPGGIFGRTAQLSSLFCGWGGFWVGPMAFVGYRAVPWGAWVLALWSLLVLPLLICHPLFNNC